MSGFFPQKGKFDTQTKAWVDKLMAVLTEKSMFQGKQNDQWWLRKFADLRDQEGPLVVDEVLDWYCEHMGEPYVPTVYTPLNFCDKFKMILAAMKRDIDQTEVSDVAKKMSQTLGSHYSFPPEIAAVLPQLITISQRNWDAFCEKVINHEYHGGFPLEERQARFLNRVMRQHAPGFVMNWMSAIGEKYRSMEHYTGNVMMLAFTPNSVLFKESFWRMWAQEWCADANAFDYLLDRLVKGKR
jgi:hypothetical protein